MPFDRIRNLLELLAKLRAMFPDISLEDLFAAVAALSKLVPLPDLDNEAECRQWCVTACGVLDQIDDLTTTTIDDKVVDTVTFVVENHWDLLWMVIHWATRQPADAPDTAYPIAADALGEKVGVSPAVIMLIVQAVIQIIKMWKESQK